MREIKINNKKRIETGHLRINDDWCGLFIRGDNAKLLGYELEKLIEGKSIFEVQMSSSILELIKQLPR